MFNRVIIILILLANCPSTVFAGFTHSNPKKKEINKDSASDLTKKGFRNLFTNEQFNPALPYQTQINPNAVPFVSDYLNKNGKTLNSMKIWGQPYFQLMDAILQSYGIPKELKYLAVIESHLKSWAYSWAGAVGPWQFMPATGKRMGLVINGYRDDRTDYYKSTHAAAKYLKELYKQLGGDWLLVIAAYNGGPGRVLDAIKKTNSRDFWILQNHLPLESRNHVKKFIGTHYFLEGEGGITTATKNEWASFNNAALEAAKTARLMPNEEMLALMNGTDSTQVQGKYNSVVIANSLSLDIQVFNKLNPSFDKLVSEPEGYPLRLPIDKLDQFNAYRYTILHMSILAQLQSASSASLGYPAPKPLPVIKK